ncbi:MAG: hypothetical protein H7A38_06545 [Chlamydiales bacterium]|nr:hypothetical protein [Chlamydiales bacterium]
MNREFSVKDGFQVIMLFFQSLWYNVLKPEAVSVLTPEVIEDNDFFFLTVCIGSSADKYFEKVIERTMKIPPKYQHNGLYIRQEMLFKLSIDFCEYFNERFQKKGNDSLRFAIERLEKMIKFPQEYSKEWGIWDQMVKGVTQHGEKSLGFF